MIKIKFKKVAPKAQLPAHMTEGAACFDFVAQRIQQIDSKSAIAYFGLVCEFPKEYKLCIVPRSSLCGTGWEQVNAPGQVDSDYRGELQMRFDCYDEVKGKEFPYKAGDRVGQGFLQEVIPVEFEEVETLSETKRGTGGYGSTGK